MILDIALGIFYMGAVLKEFSSATRASPTKHTDWFGRLGRPVGPPPSHIRGKEDHQRPERWKHQTIQELIEQFENIDANYREYQWTWTYKMICDYYGISEITLEDANRIHEDYIKARRSWIAEIKKDAEKEFAMGDVEEVFAISWIVLTRKSITIKETDDGLLNVSVR